MAINFTLIKKKNPIEVNYLGRDAAAMAAPGFHMSPKSADNCALSDLLTTGTVCALSSKKSLTGLDEQEQRCIIISC